MVIPEVRLPLEWTSDKGSELTIREQLGEYMVWTEPIFTNRAPVAQTVRILDIYCKRGSAPFEVEGETPLATCIRACDRLPQFADGKGKLPLDTGCPSKAPRV